jgi:hypothetical protein
VAGLLGPQHRNEAGEYPLRNAKTDPKDGTTVTNCTDGSSYKD